MARTQFVPARNSRHRAAALALYRAILRAGKHIVAPEGRQEKEVVSSITNITRARFNGNKGYTSSRLIYAAMGAGYNFLTVLVKARNPTSSEYAFISKQLKHDDQRQTYSQRRSKAPRTAARANVVPLLKNVAEPGTRPHYISDILPRSREVLKKSRRIPVMGHTSSGLPFLRLKKDQPSSLSRSVGLKERRYANTVLNIVTAEQEWAWDFALEDQWDYLVERQRHVEGFESSELDGDVASSFCWTAHLSKLWWEWKAECTWTDWIARGKALQRILEQERHLAAQEQARGNDASPTALFGEESQRSKQFGSRSASSKNILDQNHRDFFTRIKAQMATEKDLIPEGGGDPFASNMWRTLVKLERPRLISSMLRRNSDSGLNLHPSLT